MQTAVRLGFLLYTPHRILADTLRLIMASKSQRPNGRDGTISSLNKAISALNLAKTSNIAPAKVAFGSTSDLLTTIRVGFPLVHVIDC